MLATTCLNQVLFVCPLLFSCGFSVLHSAAMSVLFILLFSPAPLPFSYLPDAQKMLWPSASHHSTDSLNLSSSPLLLFSFLCAAISVITFSVALLSFISSCSFVLFLLSPPMLPNLLLYLCLSDSQFDVWSACHNLISVLPPTLLTPALWTPFICQYISNMGCSSFVEFFLLLPAVSCCCLLSVAAASCCLLLPAHCTWLEVVKPECWARGQGPGHAFTFINWRVSCLLTWHFSVMSSMSSQRTADSLEVHLGRFYKGRMTVLGWPVSWNRVFLEWQCGEC